MNSSEENANAETTAARQKAAREIISRTSPEDYHGHTDFARMIPAERLAWLDQAVLSSSRGSIRKAAGRWLRSRRGRSRDGARFLRALGAPAAGRHLSIPNSADEFTGGNEGNEEPLVYAD